MDPHPDRISTTIAGVEIWGNVPDRWYENTKYRCENGHVSLSFLKSEALRSDVCLACQKPILITFPEDEEGNVLGAEIFAMRHRAAAKNNRDAA